MMRNTPSIGSGELDSPTASGRPSVPPESQTLLRGLDLLNAVSDGPMQLAELAATLGLSRSTAHRLATALAERRYLSLVPGRGYQLGPKWLELGFHAAQKVDLVDVARPRLQALAQETGETVHLGVRDGDSASCLDRIAGRRRTPAGIRAGDRRPLTATALGKALLLDLPPARWKALLERDSAASPASRERNAWLERMSDHVEAGRVEDWEEDEGQLRSIAVAIRDASDAIVGAISLSYSRQDGSEARIATLLSTVEQAARSISSEFGWAEALAPGSAGRSPGRAST